VQQSVTDSVGQGRVADIGMPVTDRALAGNDRSARLVAVFYDLQQVPAFPISLFAVSMIFLIIFILTNGF
jgi:hypothetical protein